MSITKNTASQGVYLAAYDTAASPVAGKASDQANITGAWSKDGGAETAGFTTANPTNIGGGVYWQPLTQAETNGDQLALRWASSTSGVVIDPIFVSTSTAPVAVPTAAAIATAVWTDTTAGDFTTLTSPGKIIFAQLGGAFTTTSSSVFSTASLANGPTGGSAPTVSQIATAVWQDATAGDFTASSSIGKSLYTLAVSSAGGVTLANSVTHGGAGATLVISQLTAQSTAIFDAEGRVKVSIPGI